MDKVPRIDGARGRGFSAVPVNGRSVAAWMGIAPLEYSTRGKLKLLGIRKQRIGIRLQDSATMERTVGIIREAYADFERIFGRPFGNPFFEEYMTDAAVPC